MMNAGWFTANRKGIHKGRFKRSKWVGKLFCSGVTFDDLTDNGQVICRRGLKKKKKVVLK